MLVVPPEEIIESGALIVERLIVTVPLIMLKPAQSELNTLSVTDSWGWFGPLLLIPKPEFAVKFERVALPLLSMAVFARMSTVSHTVAPALIIPQLAASLLIIILTSVVSGKDL